MSLPKLIVISNPFDPEIHTFDIPEGKKIGDIIKDVEDPIVFLNKEQLDEIDRDYVLQESDELAIFVEPGDGLSLFLAIASLALAVASTIYFLTQLPDEPEQLEKSPTYSLSPNRNAARLGEAIPVQYGKMRVYPDLLAAPWVEYASNDQYLHQLFVIGKGEYNVTDLRLSDTPIASFDEIDYEISYEGPISLFPTNVENSVEVANQELSTSNTGPFIANSANTDAYRIAVDIVFPEGLYRARSSGDIDAYNAENVIVEYQEINDSGTPIGIWTTGATRAFYERSLTPLHKSIIFTVTPARYQIRVRRSKNQNPAQQNIHDRILWEGMRGFTIDTETWSNTTVLAVRMKATEQLSALSSRTFNVLAERKIPIRSGGTWTAAQVTRSPAWAIADIIRNSDYGAGKADSVIDNSAFETFATWCTTNSFNYDGRFDSVTNMWKAMEQIAASARGYMVTAFDVIGVKAEDTQNLPAWTFNRANIQNETFQLTYDRADDYDSVESRYLDETNDYQEDILLTTVTGTSDKPRELDFRRGITNRAHLYKINKFLAGKEAYSNLLIEFDTELEGYLPERGDLISVATDAIGDMSIAGEVLEYNVSPAYIILSQEVDTDQAVQHAVVLRQRDGSVSGPHNGTIDSSNPAKINLSAPLGWDPSPVAGEYNVIAAWGELDYSFRKFVVNRVIPKSESVISIEATIYDARVYDLTGTAPAPKVRPELSKVAERPSVYNIRFENTAIPNRVGVSWQADQGWSYFAWQISRDGTIWSRSSFTYVPYVELDIPLNDSYTLYFRVRAIGEFAGDWVSSSLSNAGSTDYTTPDTAVTGLVDPLLGADYDMEATLTYTWNASADIPQYYWTLKDGNGYVFLDGYTSGTTVVLSQAQIVACGQATGRVAGVIGRFDVYPTSNTQSTNLSLGQGFDILNAQMPAPNNVVLTEGFNAFTVSTTVTSPPNDFKGMRVFVGNTPGFTPDVVLNMVYDGEYAPVITIPSAASVGTVRYIRVDLYDIFGKDNTSLYSEVTITITKNVEADYVLPQQFGSSIIQNSYLDQGRVRSSGLLLPAGWYLNGNAEGDLQYSDSNRDKVLLTTSVGTAEMLSSAFSPNVNATYEINIRIRSTSGTPTVTYGVMEKNSIISAGKTAVTASAADTFVDSQINVLCNTEKSTTAALTTSFSNEIYTYTPSALADWSSVFVRADAGESYEIDYIFVRDVSLFSANASRTLALRKNRAIGSTSNGDAILVGFNDSNVYDETVNGTIVYDGTEYEIERDQFSAITYQDVTVTTNPTYSANKEGWIVYNVSATFTVMSTTVKVAFAWRDTGNSFLYDRADTSPGGFTGSALFVALGWMKMSADGNTIASAALFPEPVPIQLAPEPGSTLGATLGTNIFDTDGSTLLSGLDIMNDNVVLDALPAWNKNPSFREFTDRNGVLGPAHWIANSVNDYPTYESDAVRDIMVVPNASWIVAGAAIRANPKTTYEFLALCKSDTNKTVALRSEEYDSDLPQGKLYISNAHAGGMVSRTRGIDVVLSASLTAGVWTLVSGNYKPTSTCKWFSPSVYGNNDGIAYKVDWYVVRDRAIDRAVMGDSVYAADASTLLGDIDVRNDQLVTNALSAINANASFQLPRENTDGSIAPASWYSPYSAKLRYEDDAVRDVLYFPSSTVNGAVNAAFPVIPGTNYKITALIKHTGGASGTNAVTMRIEETSDNLGTGERAVYAGGAPGGGDPAGLFHTANTTAKASTQMSTTSAYTVQEFDYYPSANAKWASISIFEYTTNAIHVEWVALRAGGATTGLNIYDQNGDPLYAGENSPAIGGLLFNGTMFQLDYERNAPAGWYLSQSTDATALTSFIDSGNRVLRLGDGTASSLRANSTAFQVNPNAVYRISVRLRGNTSGGSGLYIRLVELDSDLTQGKIAVAQNAATSPTPSLLQEDTREATTVNLLLTRISGGTDFEDDPVPSTYSEYVGTYKPTSTAKWASVQIMNWSGFSGYLYIDRVSVNVDPGALAASDTVTQPLVSAGALTRVSQYEAAGPITFTGTTFVTLGSVDITLPSSITNTRVLIDFIADIEVGDTAGTPPPEAAVYPMYIQLLDDDSTQVDIASFSILGTLLDSSQLIKEFYGWRQLAYSFTVPPANLNAGQVNTFTIRGREVTALASILKAREIRLRATALHQSLTG